MITQFRNALRAGDESSCRLSADRRCLSSTRQFGCCYYNYTVVSAEVQKELPLLSLRLPLGVKMLALLAFTASVRGHHLAKLSDNEVTDASHVSALTSALPNIVPNGGWFQTAYGKLQVRQQQCDEGCGAHTANSLQFTKITTKLNQLLGVISFKCRAFKKVR